MPRSGSRVISPRLYDALGRAQRYQQRVTVQRPASTSRTGSGARLDAWESILIDTPCQIAPHSGGEIRRPDGTLVIAPVQIELNGFYEVNETYRATDAYGQTYDIILVEHASADGRTRLTCERTQVARP